MKSPNQFSHKSIERRHCFETTESNSFADDGHPSWTISLVPLGKSRSLSLLFRENDHSLFLHGAVSSNNELKNLPNLLFIQTRAVLSGRKLKVMIHWGDLACRSWPSHWIWKRSPKAYLGHWVAWWVVLDRRMYPHFLIHCVPKTTRRMVRAALGFDRWLHQKSAMGLSVCQTQFACRSDEWGRTG
jgi:hypothetical protein